MWDILCSTQALAGHTQRIVLMDGGCSHMFLIIGTKCNELGHRDTGINVSKSHSVLVSTVLATVIPLASM